jgi:Na+-transporting methylmalonyl-CoA/oxaloacetate decarboxylase gamma subunit
LRSAQHATFVGFFLVMFGSLVLVMLVIDELGAVIRRLFPERAESPKPVS